MKVYKDPGGDCYWAGGRSKAYYNPLKQPDNILPYTKQSGVWITAHFSSSPPNQLKVN